nr:translation initiation factor IF-2-like [Anser cygnoides]XP_047921812.1 translation initiation factor IF-2-like [Anser cygnoides]
MDFIHLSPAHPSRKPWISAAPTPPGTWCFTAMCRPELAAFGGRGSVPTCVSSAHLGCGTCRSPRCSPCAPSGVGASNATAPGRALAAPTFLALKTGREQAALLFSVQELERDLRAVPGTSQRPGCRRGGGGGGRDAAPRAQRAASLHPCPGPILSFGGRAPAQGCRQGSPLSHPAAGPRGSHRGTAFGGSASSSGRGSRARGVQRVRPCRCLVGHVPAAPGIRGHSAGTPACEECGPRLVSPLKPRSCPPPEQPLNLGDAARERRAVGWQLTIVTRGKRGLKNGVIQGPEALQVTGIRDSAALKHQNLDDVPGEHRAGTSLLLGTVAKRWAADR